MFIVNAHLGDAVHRLKQKSVTLIDNGKTWKITQLYEMIYGVSVQLFL